MSLQIQINSIDRSASIDWPSISKDASISKSPHLLEFEIKKTSAKTVPDLGDDVKLYEGASLEFGGVVTEKTEVLLGGVLIGYTIRCKDYSHLLDRKLVVKSYANQGAGDIIKDIIDTFTTGFTYTNIPASTPTIASIKFNYEQPSKAIQQICDIIGWDWKVDYTKDIHLFQENSVPAPFNLADTSGKYEWSTLETERNILELKNSIIVRGGKYKSTIAEADAVDVYEADGTEEVFKLIYDYTGITVEVDGVAQTVGTDNLTDESTVDCLYNFQQKAIRFTTGNKPTVGQIVKVYGDAYIPLIAKVRDNTSISTYGEYQGLIINKSAESITEAQALGKAELRKWAAGAYEASFKTAETGLEPGQSITVQSTIRGINKSFKISKISGKAKSKDEFEYTIYLLASGEMTLTDILVELLNRERKNVEITDDEVLQRLEIVPEILMMAEVITPTGNSRPYTWGPGGSNDCRWGFATWN